MTDIFKKTFNSLKKTRKNIANAFSVVSGKRYVDQSELDAFEEALILSDLDLVTIDEIVDLLQEKINSEENLSNFVIEKIKESIKIDYSLIPDSFNNTKIIT